MLVASGQFTLSGVATAIQYIFVASAGAFRFTGGPIMFTRVIRKRGKGRK